MSAPRPAGVRRMAAWTLAVVAGLAPSHGEARGQTAGHSPDREAAQPGEEGPLGHQGRGPIAEAAAEHLGAGDSAFARALARALSPAPAPAGDSRALAEAFDAWRAALGASRPGDGVPFWPHPGRNAGEESAADPRRTEGVEAAVLRRLAALGPDRRELWVRRFAPLAEQRLLEAGSDPEALAAVERTLPATPAAARAALRLADLAIESNRPLAARTWVARGHAHLERLGPSTDGFDSAGFDSGALAAALDRRLAGARAPALDGEAAWERATTLQLQGLLSLEDPIPIRPPLAGSPLGRGLRPGLVFLADGRPVVQSISRLFVLAHDGRSVEFLLDAAAMLAGSLGEPSLAHPPQGPPGWLLQPAARGRSLVLIEGRGSGRSGMPGALLSIELPLPRAQLGPLGARESLGRTHWALRGSRRLEPDGSVSEPADLLPLATGEWQPAPLWLDERIAVSQRRAENEAEAQLVGLDARTGDVAFAVLVARGAERSPDLGRFDGGRADHGASALPVAAGERIFLGTHLGVGALVDALDGRLVWTFANQRAPGGEPRWSGAPAVHVPGAILWAPADSDFLYSLPDGPFPDGDLGAPPEGDGGAAPWWAPPWPRGSALELLGGEPGRALVLARSGARVALREVDLVTGASRDAVHLAPGEVPREGALVGRQRVLLSTDRALYLFDRGRELYLLDQQPLPHGPLADRVGGAAPERIGGSLHPRGERIFLLELDRLLVFGAL